MKHLNSTQCARQQLPSKSYAACAQPHAQRPYRPCVLSSRGWLRSRRCFWRNYTSFFAGLSHQKRLRDEAFLAAVQRPLFCLNTRHRKLRHSCMRVQGRGSYLAPRCSHLWLCGWKLTAPLSFCHYCSSLFWRLVRPQCALAVESRIPHLWLILAAAGPAHVQEACVVLGGAGQLQRWLHPPWLPHHQRWPRLRPQQQARQNS